MKQDLPGIECPAFASRGPGRLCWLPHLDFILRYGPAAPMLLTTLIAKKSKSAGWCARELFVDVPSDQAERYTQQLAQVQGHVQVMPN